MNKKRQAVLYCDPRSLNDATNYYCGIIIRSLEKYGYKFAIVHNIKSVSEVDIIVTITEQYFLKSKIRFPHKKQIYWAQGVNAEETKMQMNSFEQFARYCFRRVAESIAVKYADMLFCVSERMVQYYREKYGLIDNGQIIVMPCYNLRLSSEFNTMQYTKPIFAYAGNTSVWQGVDFMLDVFALVEKQIPDALLNLYSSNKSELEEMIKVRGIKNYRINYVPVSELQNELHKCKYGFIIRTDHIVNLVATPTKMNSYLAAYMIPIYSDGVDDFNKNIQLGKYRLMAHCPLNAGVVAQQIIEFENSINNFEDYMGIVKNVFDNHYNDELYESKILEKMKNIV